MCDQENEASAKSFRIMPLEQESKLITSRVDIFDHPDIPVGLDVRWRGVPLALNGLWWCDFVKFGSHILLLGDPLDGLVVHENLQSFLIDTDGAGHFSGFNIDLHRNTADEGFDCALHEVYRSEVIILRLFARDSWLHEKACHGL